MMQDLTQKTLAKMVNASVYLTDGEKRVELQVVECKPLNARGRSQVQREPFSLVFRGPKNPVLPQRIYQIDFGALGAFDIFIVPVGPDDRGMRYEAVFN
jgi:hypothetical protein